MKRLYCITLAVLMTAVSSAQQYRLLGFYEIPASGKNAMCRDWGMEDIPLASGKEYSKASGAFMRSHPKQSPWTHLLTPDRATIVFEYQKSVESFGCVKKVLGKVDGTDMEDARRNLAKWIVEYRKSLRSDPKPILEWKGSEYKKTIVLRENGLEVQFTTGVIASGKTAVYAQGKNSSDSKVAVVLKSGTGDIIKTISIEPGGRFNHNLGKQEEFYFEVYKEKSAGVMDWINSIMKDLIMVKDGRLKSKYYADGSRG